jgi:tRNA-dihydrouridine synthase A
VPPLRYEVVHRLRREFPELTIVLNGGLRSPGMAAGQMTSVGGVMIGREAYENPWSLSEFETAVLGAGPIPASRHAVVEAMIDYAAAQAARGVPVRAIARHVLGLFNGLPGARAWRRRLAMAVSDEGPDLLRKAAALVTMEDRRVPGAA